ncbi:hypothetical protein [Shewanella sp. Actino-trap-3]|uniref:hypothetical protein n=1 Tax=Shewanella sp. Actino-trap-3 TaxID=2058331 RepID=UPI0012FE8747|nr:hypothetical protein [Shewanella sp. Actino-trap-3]
MTGNVIDGSSDDGPISVTTFPVAGDATGVGSFTADGTDDHLCVNRRLPVSVSLA